MSHINLGCQLQENPGESSDDSKAGDPKQYVEEEEKKEKERQEKKNANAQEEDNEPWSTIQFYERDVEIGEAFCARERSVLVSGIKPGGSCCQKNFYISELPNRSLSLRSMLVNSLNIEFNYYGGKVFITNHSPFSIYTQGWVTNEIMNKHKATVVEIGANVGPVYVFCLEIYADLLNRTTERMTSAIHATGLEEIARCTMELNKMYHRCVIRISLQPYGEKYERNYIKETDHWIELKLSTAQIWLNKVKAFFANVKLQNNQN
ncbi:Oidioi.mRNA.OKI2018_I69.XSR.g16524.t1.cds [Oikopleura dioica]|uniref:Oidioi.mRNA.OKI2018_I69.XSR.g16524.t1.cds n=1 Tax=Oikopleura dioica TaxID=34765 RepID=A0ABN7SQR0_OIKDI|nr:Oidioi.mRNA.OKI2018_I69.XSR.g16524.t1.cds [Oikopleura dioica]